MPKVPYPYEVNGKLVTGNGSLIPICSLSNRSLLPSLTVHINFDALHRIQNGVPNFNFSSRQELISHFEYFNEKTAQKNKKKTL